MIFTNTRLSAVLVISALCFSGPYGMLGTALAADTEGSGTIGATTEGTGGSGTQGQGAVSAPTEGGQAVEGSGVESAAEGAAEGGSVVSDEAEGSSEGSSSVSSESSGGSSSSSGSQGTQADNRAALDFGFNQINLLLAMAEAASVRTTTQAATDLAKLFHGQDEVFGDHMSDLIVAEFGSLNVTPISVTEPHLATITSATGIAVDKAFVTQSLAVWQDTLNHLNAVVNGLTGDAKTEIQAQIALGNQQVSQLNQLQSQL